VVDISFDRAVRINTGENSISFILDDDNLFNEVGYKVLQNQGKYGLIKCVKLSQNGKIKLVYDVTGYKTLGELLPRINQQNYLHIISQLYDVVKHIQENGFIRCENVILGIDKIFIDVEDLSVHLICLPINNVSRYQNIQHFQEDLRQVVLAAAKAFPTLQVNEILKLISGGKEDKIPPDDKSPVEPPKEPSRDKVAKKDPPQQGKNGDSRNLTTVAVLIAIYQVIIIGALIYAYYNVDDIGYYIISAFGLDVILSLLTYSLLSRAQKGASVKSVKKNTSARKNIIVLTSTNIKDKIRFEINKEVFLIGKQAGTVDGVISNDKTISRIHCKIIRKGKKYYIQDMGSRNGTYVNNVRLEDGQQLLLNRGDVIRLAKLEFIIE